MISPRHLAVLRAALQYFDEELGSHGMDAMRPYFEGPLAREVTSPDIQRLRSFLRDCQLRYASYSPQSDQLMSTALWAAPNEVLVSTAELDCRVVTIIVPPTDQPAS